MILQVTHILWIRIIKFSLNLEFYQSKKNISHL